MTTYIALFRGLNIGGHNKLPMSALVTLLAGIGCHNVRTYIQSGNVIFNSNKRNRSNLAHEITQSISSSHGFSPKVILLTQQELLEAITNNPYPTDNGKSLHFLFLVDQPDRPNLDRLNEIKTDSESFKLIDSVFYLYTPDGFGRSTLAGKVEKYLGVATTGRNWNTINHLASMLNSN